MRITRRIAASTSKANPRWMGKNYPGRRQVMFKALMNTRPSHLLDPQLFDFEGLTVKKQAVIVQTN